ncbi:MAG: hypothetical protein H7Y88_07660 [Phycisphaerales bacterium]|nr:hypothetical protein [Phycisphaerales bacterium]
MRSVRPLASSSVLVLVIAAGPLGCATQPIVRESESTVPPVGIESGGTSGLDFFDDLDSRALATRDDGLYALLLLGTGETASTPESRALAAIHLGWLDPDQAAVSPRQAVRTGDLALMLHRLLEPRSSRGERVAMARLKELSILPSELSADDGLSGPQLLAVLFGARAVLPDKGPVAALPPPNATASGAGGVVTAGDPDLESFDDVESSIAAPRPSPAPSRTVRPTPQHVRDAARSTRVHPRPEPLPDEPLAPPATTSPSPARTDLPPAQPTPKSRFIGGKPLKPAGATK